jgi:predicted metal-binding membrane protein
MPSTFRPSDAPSSALRDQWLVAAGVGALLLFCWGYLAYMVWGMADMSVGADMLIMPRMTDWLPVDLLLVFLMWVVMMAAMMLPSAAPMIWIYSRMARGRPGESSVIGSTAAFVCGYLLVWIAFSLAATLAQWGLLEARLVSPMMESASPWLSAALLAAAGVFQFTPLKDACLAKCRSPLGFFLAEWRGGASGALVMGARHGVFCTGCCWALMLLLFVYGVMNLYWIALLTVLVLIEKLAPRWRWFARGTGLALLGLGAVIAYRAV